MRLLRDILLIYRRQVRQSLRVPMTLVLGLLQPILYLLFFGPVFAKVSKSFGTEATGLELFVPGILVQLGMFSSSFVGFGIIAELRLGIIERFRVTPVSRLALLLGRVLRDASLLGLQGCVVMVLRAGARPARADRGPDPRPGPDRRPRHRAVVAVLRAAAC